MSATLNGGRPGIPSMISTLDLGAIYERLLMAPTPARRDGRPHMSFVTDLLPAATPNSRTCYVMIRRPEAPSCVRLSQRWLFDFGTPAHLGLTGTCQDSHLPSLAGNPLSFVHSLLHPFFNDPSLRLS